jgi:hypothetical protein
MLNMTNILMVVVILIALDVYKKRTLDIKGLGLKAIKIGLLCVVVKSLISAIVAVLDPGIVSSLLNRTVDIATANVIITAVSVYMFLNVEKMYNYIVDIISGIVTDLKGMMPKRSKKANEPASAAS